MRRLLTLLLALAVFPVHVLASGGTHALAITVRAASGAPLSGVSVLLAETGDQLYFRALTADASGRVTASVPDGVYRITVDAVAERAAGTPLAPTSVYAIAVASDRGVEVVVPNGRIVDTCVIGVQGRPLEGAEVTVYNTALDALGSYRTDAGGWVRFPALSTEYAFVTPPPAGGEIARWLRIDEIGTTGEGFDRPIALSALSSVELIVPDVARIFRGAAPGRHFAVTIVAEGFTDLDEPFVDSNGNGRCDDEPFLDVDGNGRWAAPEPFVDANRNGRRDHEPFTDTNGDGVCNRGERARFFAAAAEFARGFLGLPVYRGLGGVLDVNAVFVASAQAGSDVSGLPVPIVRDTAFGSLFYHPVYTSDLDQAAAAAYARDRVDSDAIAVVTNDVFGLGRANSDDIVNLFATSMPSVTVTLGHELGHNVAGLGDEYFYYDGAAPYIGPEPAAANVTVSPLAGALKWGRFLRGTTALPTPDGEPGVGAFEGGRYRRRGIYRPSYACLMRGPAPVFCPICADAMQKRIATTLGTPRPALAEITLPIPGATVAGDSTVAISVDDPSAIERAHLLVDGAPVGASTSRAPFDLAFDAGALPAGRHELTVAITLVTGGVVTTAPVAVTNEAAGVDVPTFSRVTAKGGRLVFEGATNFAAEGTVAVVNGVDRFPVEAVGEGRRTVKTSVGSFTGLRLSRLLRRGDQVSVRIRTPRGGVSTAVMVRGSSGG